MNRKLDNGCRSEGQGNQEQGETEMKFEVRYWKNDRIKSQITTDADSLEHAIMHHLNTPGWIDARGWPIELGTEGELFAFCPNDPACMIEAVACD